MSRVRIFLVLSIALLLTGAGCTVATPDKLKVAATIPPLYDLVRTIAGDDVDTVLILPPGASPHTFEPTASTMKQLQGVSVIFEIGHGLDNWFLFLENPVDTVVFVGMDKNIQLRAATDSDEHDSGSFDPHYWMDPTNALSMVDTIVEELSLRAPEHAVDFNIRAERFKEELKKKDFEWQQKMAQVRNKNIITFHDSFMYFADHFGLTVVATFEPFPGREPSPQYLIQLKQGIDEHNVRTLYLEPQLSPSSFETFAKDTNLTIATLDPEGSQERVGYIEMMDYNVQTIVENQDR